MASPVVPDRPEQGTFDIAAMSRPPQIVIDRALRGRIDRDKTDLVALALDPKMQDALAAMQVLDPESAELFAANAVIQQCRQNGPVPQTFQCVGRRGFQELARLNIA